jgi:hypothetical protein
MAVVVLLLFNAGHAAADSDNSVFILIANYQSGEAIPGEYEIMLSDGSSITGKTDDGQIRFDPIHSGIFTFTFSFAIKFKGIALAENDLGELFSDEIDVVGIDLDELDLNSIDWNSRNIKIPITVDLFSGGSYLLMIYQSRGMSEISR